MATEEQQKNRELLAQALRSGTYKQTKGVLRNNKQEYCCLGVACEISKLGEWTENNGSNEYLGRAYGMPEEVRKHYGFQNQYGTYNKGSLMSHNDIDGMSFEQISNEILDSPEGLFYD